MAEYRVEFTADSSAAERSIKNLKREIKSVTKEFEGAEIGATEFLEAANDLSGLQKELKDARSAVVNIDRAYQDLNKALDSMSSAYDKAGRDAQTYHNKLLGLAQDSFREEDRLRDKNFQAEVDDFDRRLKLAAASASKMSAQQRAIMEFRAGMGARGAIPEIASPIRGGIEYGPAYGSAGSPAYLEEVAKAAQEAQQELDDAAKTAGTIAPSAKSFQPSSLAAYEAKLKVLKAEARLISPDSTRWKELNKQILQAERGIENINKRQRLGPTGGQRLGAAGGAFLYGGGLGGGLGSALGGVAGGLAGGVPGAFAGAALGQLADNVGQALGATASYTAEIDKQRIALKNVTKDVGEYQGALAFIDQTSRSLAIPQDVLNKQFTQLSASVIGAGGNIDLAKEAFIGIAAGIRGTGGSLADMEGALRATAQVFSKGKVSAEELRQQIGERLPGAFTLFAKSMGKTPQELDKMLEQGQVTLNDFMSFVRTLSSEYGASASEIAASSQAAGDRLATTMARMREAVGRELQPLGAQFQEILARAVADNEGNLVALAKAFSEAAQAIGRFIEQYGGLIASLGSTILLIGGTALAVKGIATAYAAIGPAIATATAAIASYGGALSVAKLAMAGLGGPITLTIAGLVLLGKGVYDTNETFRNFVDNIGGVIASDFKNAVEGMAEDARSSADNIQTAYKDLTTKLEPIGQFIKQLFKDVFKSTSDSAETSATASSGSFNDFFNSLSTSATEGFNGLNTIISNWWSGLPAPIRNIFAGNAASMLVGAAGYAAALPGRTSQGKPERQGPYLPPNLPNRNAMGTPLGSFVGGSGGGSGGGGKNKGADDAKKLREEMARQAAAAAEALFAEEQRLLILQQTNPIAEAIAKYTSEEASIQRELNAGLKEAKSEKEKIDLKEAARLQGAANRLGLERSINDEAEKALKPITDLLASQREELALTTETEKLMKEGISPERAKQIAQVRLLVKQQLEALDLSINQTEAAILEAKARGASVKAVEDLIAALDRLKEKRREGEGQGEAAEEGVPKDKPKDYLGDALTSAEARLKELLNPAYQLAEAAKTIGDSFGEAFKGIITGSMTVQEAFAGLFQSIADRFADMVAEMIARWLEAQLIKGFLSLFPGAAPAAEASQAVLRFADGGVASGGFQAFANGGIASGGFRAFANGGIVTGPTLGLVGEGKYNEAVIPLPDGKSVPVDLGGMAGGMGGEVTSNIVVNINNGQMQGNGNSNGSELGRKIEGAVKQVLVSELRPGGILSSGRR